MAVAGITTYGFLYVAGKALSNDAYGPLGVLWAVLFTAGPGFFLPLEQEVSRALAARRARGLGSGPLVRRAALLGAGILGVLVVLTIATGPVVVDRLFSGQWLLLLGLAVGLVGYWMGHLARGTASGLGRFKPYSVYVGAEGVVRLVGCLILLVIGVETAGMFGVVLGAAPIAAVLIAMRNESDIVTDGPEAPWSELSTSLGALLAASVLAQALSNAGVIAMRLLESDHDKVGTFFKAVIVARLPLFLFQAVQAALLPKLSALAGAGMVDEFKAGFRRLLMVVAGVGGLGIVGALVAGPMVGELAFGGDLTRSDLGLLAAGSAAYMLALAVAQALIALHGQNQVAACWLGSVVAFVLSVAAGSGLDVYKQVEVALLVGSVVALASLGVCTLVKIRRGAIVETGDLIAALHDIHLEP